MEGLQNLILFYKTADRYTVDWNRLHYITLGPPILQTKHENRYKLHKICQFAQFIFEKIILNLRIS